jgi:hypothetical protein
LAERTPNTAASAPRIGTSKQSADPTLMVGEFCAYKVDAQSGVSSDSAPINLQI